MVEHHGFFEGREDRPESPRERRIAEAREKEMVRLALGSTARYGCYVFDELITEESGLLDYLTVGPRGVIVVLVRSDLGCVGFGQNEDQILLDGKPFEDDPFRQGAELVTEVSLKLFGHSGEVTGIVCFTRASFEVDEERRPPPGTTPIWELSRVFNADEEENVDEELLSPADIEEIAEKVREVYGRPPIVTSEREDRQGRP